MMEDGAVPLQEGHHIAVLVPHSVHDGTAVVPAPAMRVSTVQWSPVSSFPS